MKTASRRLLQVACLAGMSLGVLAGSSGSALADKLVVFKNGKALRVKAVKQDGVWLKCEFAGGNFLSVPASGIQAIEEASGKAQASAHRANQLAPGSRGYRAGRSASIPARTGRRGAVVPPGSLGRNFKVGDDVKAALGEGQPQGNSSSRFGRRGRLGQRQTPNPLLPAGLQPLNATGTPGQNSLTRRRGPRGGLRARPPHQPTSGDNQDD